MELKTLNLTIDVYGGSDIHEAIKELVAMARHLRCGIWADLNGVKTLARPSDDAEELYEVWARAKRPGWASTSIQADNG